MRIRLAVDETSFDSLFRCFVVELFGHFRKSEFESGICIEIRILPEHSKRIIIFKINSRDSRNSDDQ